MRALFCLTIACLAAVSYGSPTPRIVGGKSAKIGEFPYAIFMRQNGQSWCGGSIINRRYILTVAHCIKQFVNNPHALTVHAGTNFLNETGDAYNVEKVIPHPDYNATVISDDIGLLRLGKDIQYKDTVKAIGLATTEVAKAGDPCTVCGWGNLRYRGRRPNDLQKLDLRVFSHTECDKIWKDLGADGVPHTQICAFARNGQGACHGDSGSPLTAKGVQIGIVSYARPCAIGVPDVYTRVSAYKKWIDEHTKL